MFGKPFNDISNADSYQHNSSYNPLVSYKLNHPISHTQKIELPKGGSILLKEIISELHTTPKELQWHKWMLENPNYDDKERREWLKNTVFISNWNQYAFEASEGKIHAHLIYLYFVKNRKLSSSANCVHQRFGGVIQCVKQLRDVLLGSLFGFRDFLKSEICYNCLMTFCSQNKFVENLFHKYYKQCTNWNTSEKIALMWVKEIHYLSGCLLKYRCMVKYVLNNEKLYTKIFSLFVCYMKNFHRLEKDFADTTLIFADNDQGYCFSIQGMHTLHTFEYNFNGILSCIRKLMCYFRQQHLIKLIEMNYFKYFTQFLNKFFAMKYMKVLTDNVKPGANLEFKGSCTIFAVVSVITFINYRLMKKVELKDIIDQKMRGKFHNLVSAIKRTKKHVLHTKIFDKKGHLKDTYKYPLMMSAVTNIKHWNILHLLKQKRYQIRKYKRCGNENCEIDICSHNGFKLCSQCKIVYYCSKRCQKRDWSHHRLQCKLFI
eukprot:513922_1